MPSGMINQGVRLPAGASAPKPPAPRIFWRSAPGCRDRASPALPRVTRMQFVTGRSSGAEHAAGRRGISRLLACKLEVSVEVARAVMLKVTYPLGAPVPIIPARVELDPFEPFQHNRCSATH